MARRRKYEIDTMQIGEWRVLPFPINMAALHSSVDKFERKSGQRFKVMKVVKGAYIKRLA